MKGRTKLNGIPEVREFKASELFFFSELGPQIQVWSVDYGPFCQLVVDYKNEVGDDHEVEYKEIEDYICRLCKDSRILFTKEGTPVELDPYEYIDYERERELNQTK